MPLIDIGPALRCAVLSIPYLAIAAALTIAVGMTIKERRDDHDD